jgi:hypothetical protein
MCGFEKNSFDQVTMKNYIFFGDSRNLTMYVTWTASTLKSAFLFALYGVGGVCVALI